MKSSHRIALFVIIALLLIGGVFIFRDQLFVALSSIWAGSMILLGKLRNLFGGSETPSIKELQTGLDDARQIEKDLIDTLMKEREVYMGVKKRLEEEGRQTEQQRTAQKEVLKDYRDFDTWEDNVWDELSPEEQQAEIQDTFGQELSWDEFAYEDM